MRIIVDNKVIVPGQKIPVIIQGLKIPKIFGVNTGVCFIYTARLDTWELKFGVYGWNLCKIPVEGFTEGSEIIYKQCLLSGLYKDDNFVILTTKDEKKRTPLVNSNGKE